MPGKLSRVWIILDRLKLLDHIFDRAHGAAIGMAHHRGDPTFGDHVFAAQAGLIEKHAHAFDTQAARADGEKIIDFRGALIVHLNIGQGKGGGGSYRNLHGRCACGRRRTGRLMVGWAHGPKRG